MLRTEAYFFSGVLCQDKQEFLQIFLQEKTPQFTANKLQEMYLKKHRTIKIIDVKIT